MEDLLFLVPALPLAGFLVLVFAGRRVGDPLAGWFATAMCGASFLAAGVIWLDLVGKSEPERALHQTLFDWIPLGDSKVSVGFLADPLSVTMILFVTGVATLIHLYSIGYMHGDPTYTKFFIYLNLFVFSMVMLVLGDNLLITFLGWEGVGACSYLLVSFWFESDANASAGKKAFVTNRIGDFGFLVAILFAFAAFGSLDYGTVLAGAGTAATTTATVIAVMLFLGACGKSAQLPLFVWLPDAMAGPTPVSAMLHAATMVTAGVYLMVRVNPILTAASDWVPWMIAIVGAATALFAASIAIAQNDIKKVLAYSTISQLGYMFLAAGSGAYVAAVFHMVTHAFFKALLFLGSGSVIHGLHDEQDMRRMGALRKLLPITSITFIIGWLAIAGVPPFAGFWSKDEILMFAWDKSPVLWAVGLIVALMTAFYMSRQVFMVFFGDARWDRPIDEAAPELAAEREAAGVHEGHGVGPAGEIRAHESPWTMTLPLVALAGLAIVGGGLNLPLWNKTMFLEHWLAPVVEGSEAHPALSTMLKVLLAVIATIAAVAGIAFAALVYLRRRRDLQAKVEQPVLANGWYYDRAITAFTGGPGRDGFAGVAWFDRNAVDGAVNGSGGLVAALSGRIRRLQSGYVRNYALALALGTVVVVTLLASKAVF